MSESRNGNNYGYSSYSSESRNSSVSRSYSTFYSSESRESNVSSESRESRISFTPNSSESRESNVSSESRECVSYPTSYSSESRESSVSSESRESISYPTSNKSSEKVKEEIASSNCEQYNVFEDIDVDIDNLIRQLKILRKIDFNTQNIYKNLHSNQKILIYEMLKRGISVEVLDEKFELIKASYNGHDELIYDRDSSIMPYNVSVLAGDKGITKQILQSNGISVPIGEVFNVSDYESILQTFNYFDTPVVIKPVFGSHGYDVYTDLSTEEQVKISLDKIINNRGNDIKVLIEEYFDANEYRVFVTKNKDYAVLHRDPAHVYGNGVNTIEELIKIENNRRMNPRTNALCEILVDEEMYNYMSKNGISMDYVPSKGDKVYLRPNSNVAMGGICEDYTDKVHPSVIDVGMRVLASFPGLPYVGIDYMTNSIEKEQSNDSYRIIEINTVPGVHMHYRPAVGKSQNIAKYMVDLIFPETKEKSDERGIQKSLKRF